MGATQVRVSGWLHDDTEEDLVGASWHQRAIQTTASSISSVAAVRGLPWQVGNQLTLLASKPDGTAWRPSPDIMVYAAGGPAERAEMVVATDGLPALIIEVLSPSTWDYDVDTQEGKAWGYLQLGVPFYLAFDPHADLQGRSCRGWRQDAGLVQPWLPEADGRYHVPALGLSFRPEHSLLRVYDPDGKPVPFDVELSLRHHALEETVQTQAWLLEAQRRLAEDRERYLEAQRRLAEDQGQHLEAQRQLIEAQRQFIEGTLQAQAQRLAALEAELERLKQDA